MAAMAVHSQGETNVLSALAASMAMPVEVLQAVAGGSLINNASLYVGDLDASVDEAQLFNIFRQVPGVVSIRVCRDKTKHSSLGYAYVNFNTQREAANARDALNYTPINGKPIRIMFSHRDPNLRKNGNANVFVKNLEASIDSWGLYDAFSTFGNILSCKVALDYNGKSKGYGFIQYDNEESAQNAIKRLNGMLFNDKQVYVGLFVRKRDRIGTTGSQKFTNIYVKNLPETTTAEDLQQSFGKYGTITSAVVMTDENGKSRCFGFINFQKPEDAASAIENMNATTLSDKVLYVGKAQKKADREAELKAKYEQEKIARYEKLKDTNLYMKNLDDDITDDKLRDLFSPFGNITSCKVLVDSQGLSKGVGFVAFSSPEEAKTALNQMNGKMIGKKPLYVAVAQRKDERRARLQAYFAQARIHGGLASMHAARLGLYPGLIQPQVYGSQQQLSAGVRPGVIPMPANQLPQSLGGIGGGGPHHQQLMQQNSGLMGPMMQLPFGASGNPIASLDIRHSGILEIRHSGTMTTSVSATTMASTSPENQQNMLGEQLYKLVEPLVHEHAGKITGMLLEMDQSELLSLMESPDALTEKVNEAVEVLRSCNYIH